MDYIKIIGFLAAFLTTCSFIPQAVHTVKTKDTSGISLPMYVMFFIGISLWMTYGILKSDYPLIIANGITLVLSGIILWYKLREG